MLKYWYVGPRWRICLAAVAALLFWAVVPTAQTTPPSQQLQEALRLIESKGDYESAIRLLRDLTKTQERTVAARAWLLLGIAQEELGRPEAAAAYRRVLADFADQREVAVSARRRLAAFDRSRVPSGKPKAPAFRRLEWENFTPTGAPTRDGRWLPGTADDLSALVLMDLENGRSRALRQFDVAAGFPFYSAITPDGSEIAYTWYPVPGGEVSAELRVLGTASPQPRVMFSDADVVSLRPARWTRDKAAVLAALSLRDGSDQIALLFRDGRKRVLLRLNAPPLSLDLSPDDRYVVFDRPSEPTSPERDIEILDIETGTAVTLVRHPALDAFPVWTPDGDAVLFVSDRSGSLTVWLLPVTSGRPAGDARRIVPALGRVLPLGVTRSGRFYYRVLSGLVDIYIADLDFESGRISEPSTVSAGRVTGANYFSSWSDDGRTIAFTSRHAEVQFQPKSQSIVVHDLKTGRWREHPMPLSAMSYSAWSPDGRTLLLCGTAPPGEGSARQGLWLVDTTSGQPTLLVSKPGSLLRSPRWRRNGGAIVFTERSGSLSIVEHELSSGAERTVVADAGDPFEISPQDSHIAFVRRTAERHELIIAAFDESGRRVAAEFNRLMIPVGWTPDGEWVLVSTFPDFNPATKQGTEVWAVRVADGSRRRIGTITLPAARTLRVSPDGSRLSFEAGIPAWSEWVMEGLITRPSGE